MALNIQKRPPLGSYSASPRKEDADNNCESAHHSSNNVEVTSPGSRGKESKFDGSRTKRYQAEIKVDPGNSSQFRLFSLFSIKSIFRHHEAVQLTCLRSCS